MSARRAGGLTAREREVAALAAQGFTVTNVAARLEVSEPTVKTHLRRIYRKLGVASRAELACRLLLGPEPREGEAPRDGGPGPEPARTGPGVCCWNCRHYVRPRCFPEALLEGLPVSVCTAGRGGGDEEGWAVRAEDRRVEPGDLCQRFERPGG